MNEILTLPLKKGSDVDLVGPLTKWVTSNYPSNEEQLKSATEGIIGLDKMRKAAVQPNERNDLALLANSNYYDQLLLLEKKMNFSEIQINFKWKDAFDKGRKSALTKGKFSLTLSSLKYEKCSILFNIGALNSCIAAAQDLESGECLQLALKYLQTSAGIFKYLKDNVESAFKKDTIMDCWSETLDFLTNLMIAQAQEMVIFKAITERMKNAVISKLCSQSESSYDNLKKAMSDHVVKRFLPLEWRSIISQKHFYYGALAQFHQSRICHEDSSNIGEEIARLKVAQTLFSNVTVLGAKFPYKIKEWRSGTEETLASASKDNNCIYSDKIPNEEDLTPIEKVLVAKPMLIEAPVGNPEAPNLFHMLVSTAVAQAVAKVETKIKSLKVNEIDILKDATSSLNQTLSSLNLPAALEDSGSNEIPESLNNKSLSIQQEGGVKHLRQVQGNLAKTLSQIISILDVCQKSIDEKRKTETELQNKYKSDWARTSFDQIEGYCKSIERYQKLVEKASSTDKLVDEKIEMHQVFLDMLIKGPNHLKSMAPGTKDEKQLSQQPVITNLQEQMKEMEIIKAKRIVLQSKINSINPDLNTIFSKIYHESGSINEDAVSKETLEKEFGSIKKRIEINLNEQSDLISKVKENHAELCKVNVFGNSAREEMFKQLAAAYDAYYEVKGNLEEGTVFYNELIESVVIFQNTLDDFFLALDIEKEEMIIDLVSSEFYDVRSEL